MKCIELTQENTAALPEAECNAEWMLDMHCCFPRIFGCEFPSPLTNHCYVLRPRDHVGIIRFGTEGRVEIRPKIRSGLLMHVVECAHGVPAISAVASVASMGDIFEFWAEYVAVRTLQKAKPALYWGTIESETERRRGCGGDYW